jgi:hypothetical protein
MYAAHLPPYLYIVLFSSKSTPSSVHPEHSKLDEHDRPAREREVRQLARPQPPHVVHHARPENRVRHERGEPEGGVRERLHERVRRRAHAECDARAVEEVQRGERGAGLDGELRREVVVRVDKWEARERGELGERADEDRGEGNEEVLVHEEQRVFPVMCETEKARERGRGGRTKGDGSRSIQRRVRQPLEGPDLSAVVDDEFLDLVPLHERLHTPECERHVRVRRERVVVLPRSVSASSPGSKPE